MLKLKKKLPFRLGTTSFIYPDRIISNVEKLGSYFDEIELLIFESDPQDVLPTVEEIKTLVSLSKQLDVTYNVHLPLDVTLGDSSEKIRCRSLETVGRVLELCKPLNATTHTLHLEMPAGLDILDSETLAIWQKRIAKSLEQLADMVPEPRMISIETLRYPFSIIGMLVEEYDFSVCIDAGHLIKYGFSISDVYTRFQGRVPLIHLHGVDFSSNPPRDHQGLDKTPASLFRQTHNVLETFTGVVSIEVFNLGNLEASIGWLNEIF